MGIADAVCAPDQAFAALTAASASNPACAEAQAALGALFKAAGRLNEAVDSVSAALALSPHDAELQSALAALLTDQGECICA